MSEITAEQSFLQSLQNDDGINVPGTNNPAASLPTRQPRTIGGFIDDDEDEDEGAYEPGPAETGTEESLIVDRGFFNTPQQVSADSDVPSLDVSIPHASQDQNTSSAAVPNGNADHVRPSNAVQNDGVAAEDIPNTKNTQSAVESISSSAVQIDPAIASLPKARLPHDRIGVLEDRVSDDPRGDLDAWLSLITEHKKRNRVDEVRNTYERFFEIFPSAADQWVAYATMELDNNEFYRVEQIFNKSLLSVPNVQLWSLYLNYVRRRNNMTADPSGKARQIVSQTYDFVLQNVGIDKDSGPLWQDYIQFIRSGPGQLGGTGWQDQQKMDSLRKAYQSAICQPTQAVNSIWKEYDSFEMGLNKITGRKFLQEKSPSYMTARSSYTALQNITRDLNRTTLPSLPPALGFGGQTEYEEQISAWKRWIEWEKEDPLVLKDEDETAFKARIVYVYKQAIMALRFWPEMWYDAIQFCFNNGLETDGNAFISQGVIANPESCLLAFQRADRIESTSTSEEGDDSVVRRGKAVREPYDKMIDALYAIIAKVVERESQAISRLKEAMTSSDVPATSTSQDPDDEDAQLTKTDPETLQKIQIEAIKAGNAAQTQVLGRTVSYAWIALMRAMRRVQGKGVVGGAVGGFRQIFSDARSRGRITSDVYVASALMEHHCYKDGAATRIFERGTKLFKEDEQFTLHYIKHLVAINDTTNARAVFETTVARLASKPETVAKTKPLFVYFHDFESCYGELSQIGKLEQRMLELFPEDPQLHLFSQRYASPNFDPTTVRPIISPSQMQPITAIPSIEIPQSPQDSPRPSIAQAFQSQSNNSPKRPYDDSDNEGLVPPRKIVRGDSPLKGAAGRRMDAQKRTHLRNEVPQPVSQAPPPPLSLPPAPAPLPAGVLQLLSVMPSAGSYNAPVLNPERMVNLIRNTDLSLTQYLARQQAPTSAETPTPQYGYGSFGR